MGIKLEDSMFDTNVTLLRESLTVILLSRGADFEHRLPYLNTKPVGISRSCSFLVRVMES